MPENTYSVLIKPIITERSTNARAENNKFTFMVAPKANKIQIKQAVEKAFKVKVTKVNTLLQHGKKRRARAIEGLTSDWKKAVVTLKHGQVIPLFEV